MQLLTSLVCSPYASEVSSTGMRRTWWGAALRRVKHPHLTQLAMGTWQLRHEVVLTHVYMMLIDCMNRNALISYISIASPPTLLHIHRLLCQWWPVDLACQATGTHDTRQPSLMVSCCNAHGKNVRVCSWLPGNRVGPMPNEYILSAGHERLPRPFYCRIRLPNTYTANLDFNNVTIE